ncbi:MAG: Zn-ribbon domain-containing OB-fold protein [Deltaproteobacteria bacterium]|nr:Zn-ribbon domain-containing OB-fold protein [Deltaproteobacteria bacterium]MBW2399374.1 Zn-ribbon domain-containing OB-fold protein [Deltaproteobacteria bacterium]
MSERFFPDSMPPPMAETITLPWWEAAAEHRLVVQRCTSCEHTRLPPAPVCPQCRSEDSDWKEVSGRGEVYTYTIVHRTIVADQELPFFIAVIALEGAGGVRMISNLVDVNSDQIEIGLPVEIVWEDMSADLAIPRFRPVENR